MPNTTTGGSLDPVAAGTYDNELLDIHAICGDGRCNENIALQAVHQVFHDEHDRLIGDIQNVLTNDTSTSGAAALAEWKLAAGADGWNGERLFQAARFVTEMEYQHLVFEEFARKVQPGINPFEPFAFTQTDVNPAITAEFAHAVYRFGHSMLTDTIPPHQRSGVRHCWDSAPQRHQAAGRVPQPGGLLQGGTAGRLDLRRGRRLDHHGSVRPGRPGDRRVRREHPAQQPARPPAGPARDQHDTGPQ